MQFVDLLSPDHFDSLRNALDKIIIAPATSLSNEGVIQQEQGSFGWVPEGDGYEWINDLMSNVTKEVNMKFFEFDVTHFHRLQYVSYSEGQGQDDHVDYDTEIGTWDARKLSFSLLLNDDFEGGDLEILGKDKFTADRKSNSIVFYPSYLRHRITPVTKGVRKSIEGWICGPKFR